VVAGEDGSFGQAGQAGEFGGIVIENRSERGTGREIERIFGAAADIFQQAEEEDFNSHETELQVYFVLVFSSACS
jgi:hypothetical protein